MENQLQLKSPKSETGTSLLNRSDQNDDLDELIDKGDLIDRFLSQQKEMTAVSRFSQWHENDTEPSQARYYRDLIPLEKPQADEQYAFEVELDTCSGCKACVSACHSLNGLDFDETWRDVGTIYGKTKVAPVQFTVTTACHHCAEPGCLEGCPVLAYDKDPDTGIVRHLDDQCIGCQYCILKCPYDVPKFSPEKGIVRKCDMCHSRLSANEAPACVQACPNEAIKIVKVNRDQLTNNALTGKRLVPGAIDSGYTKPSTRYVVTKNGRKTELDPSTFESLNPADANALKPEHGHMPLVIMLVLTQLSVGAVGFDWLARMLGIQIPSALSWLAAAIGLAGINASVMHLGRPLKAWLVFLGLKKSWLSREVVGFGMYAPLVMSLAMWPFVSAIPELENRIPLPSTTVVSGLAFFAGLACVFCSIMVYVDTRRVFWRMSQTAGKFLGSSLLLGLCSASLFLAEHKELLAVSVVVVGAGKFLWEIGFIMQNLNKDLCAEDPDIKSARLMTGALVRATMIRYISGLVGLLVIWYAPAVSLVLLTTSELMERYLFFRAVVAPKMPGAVTAGGPNH
ncbi:MAG: DmsC/YnfH family molybdoenzyme membrane anchor subunit [Verrucomicrobiota bacterium]